MILKKSKVIGHVGISYYYKYIYKRTYGTENCRECNTCSTKYSIACNRCREINNKYTQIKNYFFRYKYRVILNRSEYDKNKIIRYKGAHLLYKSK